MRETYANANKKDAKRPAHYLPVSTLWLSWPYTVNVVIDRLSTEPIWL